MSVRRASDKNATRELTYLQITNAALNQVSLFGTIYVDKNQ